MAKELTPKQQRFVDEYLKNGCDYRGIGVQTELVPKGGWYVYFLADPRDGLIFYVGKGKGRRKFHHTSAVRRGCEANYVKEKRIRAILKDGFEPECLTFSGFAREDQALAAERTLISALWGNGLTNISPGTRTVAQIVMDRGQSMLDRMKPKDQWLREASDEQLRSAARIAGSPDLADGYDWFVDCVRDTMNRPPDRITRDGWEYHL
jgi:hypothetical protein